MVFTAEVSQVIVVGNALVSPVNFGKLYRLMPSNLRLRCFQFEPCIPSAPVRTIEPASQGMDVREGSIDDPARRHTEHQFINTDARQQVVFCQLSVICGVVKIKDALKMISIIGNTNEDAGPVRTVFGRNQPMCIKLSDL